MDSEREHRLLSLLKHEADLRKYCDVVTSFIYPEMQFWVISTKK